MSDTSIYALVRAAIADYPQNSDDTIAIEVMNRLRIPVKAAKVLHPLVENAVASERRVIVRDYERKAFSRGWSSRELVPDAIPVDVVEARAALITEGFFKVDGRYVSWADATVDDHEQKIGELRSHVAGVQRTIDAHEKAIKEIKNAGVTCLAEIEDVA